MTQQPYSGRSGYLGPSGRTRKERIRVFRPGRQPTEVEVFRVVNVAENPELSQAALQGTLQRLDDGEVIDVPFIYHDPSAEQFVLVVPHAARGRELSERAKLLDSLMKEHEEDVPDYVRHFVIVYGRHGLRRYVDDSETMEVELAELEPVDGSSLISRQYPGLASLLPPAGFWGHTSTDLAPLIDDEELWVFVQVEAGEHDAFAEASSDLLIQLKTVDQLPICVLALTDARTNSVRRAYLNPGRSADGRILELLRRDFRATVVVYGDDRMRLRAFRLEAPRAANTKLIIGRTELAPQAPRDRWERAVEACRLTPPPVDRVEHPFLLEPAASSAAEALCRLQRLEAWSGAEKIEDALLVLSVPRTVFELSRRRVISDAAGFGLAISNELLHQAVRFGLAPSAKELVATLQRNFEQNVSAASDQRLSESQIQANWAALTELSQMHGTSTVPGLSCNMDD